MNHEEQIRENLKTATQNCYSGNSIARMLESLDKLKEERNSVVMTDWTFFGLVIGEFRQGLALRVSRLYDKDSRTESVDQLIRLVQSSSIGKKNNEAERAIHKLREIEKSDPVETNEKFRSKMYAHQDKGRAVVLEGLAVPLSDYHSIFGETIRALNALAIVFDITPTADRYGADDSTLDEMRWLEKAKNIRLYIERHDRDDHPALSYNPLEKKTIDVA